MKKPNKKQRKRIEAAVKQGRTVPALREFFLGRSAHLIELRNKPT